MMRNSMCSDYSAPVLVIFSHVSINAYSQNIPDRPNPPRLVNDFAAVA